MIPSGISRAVLVCLVLLVAGLAVAPDAVRAAGAAPRCGRNTAQFPQGGSVVATIPCTDPEGDPLTYRFAFQSPGINGGPPDQGTARFLSAGPPATFRFTPARNFLGQVSVGFIANDGTSDSNQRETFLTGVLAPPVPGQTAQAKVVTGKVLVRAPGSPTFQELPGLAAIRAGSVLDLTKGRIRLTTAAGTATGRGSAIRTQTADFSEGTAVFTQERRTGLTTLTLTGGDFSSCPGGKQASWSPFAISARTANRLRGSGRGRFRTRGRYSSATVRGTTWSVEDTCAGTLTLVKTGSVEVRDFVKHRTVIVRTGGRYLAKRR